VRPVAGRAAVLAAAALLALAAPSASAALPRLQERPVPPAGALPAGATVLDVPYLPQSELLCGGAAAAMVLRYWGMAGVRADDFAHLVDRTRGGMRADELAARVRELGWDVFLFPGRFEEVRRHLRLGRPVISLTEVAEGRFHFVVLVGEAGDRLVLHDPADSPFRLIDRAELERAWAATDGLSLLIVPPPDMARNVRPPAGRARDGRPAATDVPQECRSDLDRALSAAAAGRMGDADRGLAESDCRGEPAFLRELAGVRLRRGRTGEAIKLARAALRLDSDDAHAARTLATALYVNGEPEAALDVWNQIGEPTVDLVRIAGLRRVSHRSVARLLGIRGGEILTARSLRLARRHLSDLPAAAFSRVEYTSTGGGRADLVVGLAERAGLPDSPLPLAATAVRAAIYRELALTTVSPLGLGETWSGAWRWWDGRPAVSFSFAAPAGLGPPAVWQLAAAWERETYALDVATPRVRSREERTGAALSSSLWLLPELRGAVRMGFDRWDDTGGHLRGGLTGEVRAAGDRLWMTLETDRWISLEDGPSFSTMSARLEGMSRATPEGVALSGRAYVRSAGTDAPPTLWPGAGTGIARPDLLRAHPLLDDGAITGPAFDRHLAGGGAEVVRWFATDGVVRIGPAAFLDVAHAWGERPGTSRADVGLGVRLTTAAGGPVLRIDVATGLSDDDWAISAGWSSDAPARTPGPRVAGARRPGAGRERRPSRCRPRGWRPATHDRSSTG
jgi:hypothetical protein